ncbi:MmcQ/YjbR family DNA-binding protein [Paenibacillus sp.]|uniref:MmcQ/YjbR family DNA-binding protein n=1 Tax=Paenibacillus sp. TaxID=58172 RepID=UPI002D602D16|nr:MmcQ/YjbR family DNA-binding protein [Paenibacillus sp.]HZG83673.1 MmcQ/YjbR family DNA-binding protein [Paenibacillus sp.]
MNRESIVSYCMDKRGAREDYPFGPEPLVMKVGAKMFALVSGSDPVHISLKCDPDTAIMLRQEFEAVKPGYHLNKAHWNTVVVDGSVPEKDLCWMIDHSYALVLKSMPKRERLAFEEEAK